MAESISPSRSMANRDSEQAFPTNGASPSESRQHYQHHHSIRNPFSAGLSESEPTFLDDTQIDLLLKRAIAAQCRGYGFENVEEFALERFRDIVEEYVLNFASLVRQSMIACRRVQPMFVDFEWAFGRTKVPQEWREGELPFEELEHDLKVPFRANSPPLLPTPPPDDTAPPSLDTLRLQRQGAPDRRKGLIPASFPALPAEHAYRQSPVYPKREDDFRRVRELATEEGRMGEEALRKLAGATRMETRLDMQEQQSRSGKNKSDWGGKTSISVDSMFEKTIQNVMKKEMQEHPERGKNSNEIRFELGPIVNWERKYWMQPNAFGKAKDGSASTTNPMASRGQGSSKGDAMDLS